MVQTCVPKGAFPKTEAPAKREGKKIRQKKDKKKDRKAGAPHRQDDFRWPSPQTR